MIDDGLPKKIDPLNSSLVLLLIICGGACFTLAAYRTSFGSWLVPLLSGVTLLGLAWHFARLGKLYR